MAVDGLRDIAFFLVLFLLYGLQGRFQHALGSQGLLHQRRVIFLRLALPAFATCLPQPWRRWKPASVGVGKPTRTGLEGFLN